MDEGDHPPPPGPPPLLSKDQLLHLARQGWLCLALPESLSQSIADVFRRSSSFFDQSTDEKSQCYPAKLGTEFGYYQVPGEKEYITFRCHVHTSSMTSTASAAPASAVALESSAGHAWREAAIFLYRILCDIARASNLSLSIWDDVLDGTLTMPETEEQVMYTLMRLFRYLPTTGVAEEHTDLGLLTLCVGDGAGLQVLKRARSPGEQRAWIEGGVGTANATVLVGQTLKALSNGLIVAGAHRVVGNPNGRNSVVFALRHSTRHEVDFGQFGGEGRVTPQDLWQTVQAGKVNINTSKERRDRQRAKMAAAKGEAENREELRMGQG